MHYSNLVVIEKPVEVTEQSINDAVRKVMGPSESDGGFWDWYQIGGRWTGTLDGYEPDTDPENQVVCNICNGTGMRDDDLGKDARLKDPAYTCNGCQGKGKHTSWPTQWRFRHGDILPIENLTQEQLDKFFRVVVEYRQYGGEQYLPWKPVGEMFPKNELPPLDWLKKEYAGHLVVVVDNHV